jgi:hypothetical protein
MPDQAYGAEQNRKRNGGSDLAVPFARLAATQLHFSIAQLQGFKPDVQFTAFPIIAAFLALDTVAPVLAPERATTISPTFMSSSRTGYLRLGFWQALPPCRERPIRFCWPACV